MNRMIGIVLFNDSEELDWAGPWEVLAAGAKDDVRVSTSRRYLDALGARQEFVTVFDGEDRRVPTCRGRDSDA